MSDVRNITLSIGNINYKFVGIDTRYSKMRITTVLFRIPVIKFRKGGISNSGGGATPGSCPAAKGPANAPVSSSVIYIVCDCKYYEVSFYSYRIITYIFDIILMT